MNQEVQQAAQVDPLDAFVQEAIDQDSKQIEEVTPTVESAPTLEVKQEDVKPTEESKPVDGFQKRINKVTADKHDALRERDALRAQLDAINNKPVEEVAKAPTLEEFEYDEAAFNKANISFQVQQELSKQNNVRVQDEANTKAKQGLEKFNERINALGKDDFSEKAAAVPNLPTGVADALMQSDNGAELIYHLGEHLDIADSLSQMTPAAAMMELGRLSTELNKKPEIKTSAAPEPIETLQSGGSLSTDIGDDMSIDAWMNKYN